MNMDGQISLQAPAFSSSGYIPGSGIAGSHCNSVSMFLRNLDKSFYRESGEDISCPVRTD